MKRGHRTRWLWGLLAFAMLVIPGGVAGGLGRAAAASQVPSTFLAEADARVQEASPSSNYGSSTTLRVDGGSDPEVESHLRFTVSGLPGSVQRATLRLHATSGTGDGPRLFGAGSGWTESGITWSTRAAVTSGVIADAGAFGSGSWVDFDVTALVPGNGTFSFVLVATSNDGADFHSRNSTQTSLRPQLVVEG